MVSKLIRFYKDDQDIEAIGELYCLSFLTQSFSLKDKENAIANINKHATYQGFTGYKAKDAKGNIVGFGYGYTSLPGQFYRQKIANQLAKTEVDKWLTNCFEFVELAVNPSHKRIGIGRELHDVILKENNHKTSVLTTDMDNEAAIHFYKKRGWESIKKDAPVISEENQQMIMGKVLR